MTYMWEYQAFIRASGAAIFGGFWMNSLTFAGFVFFVVLAVDTNNKEPI